MKFNIAPCMPSASARWRKCLLRLRGVAIVASLLTPLSVFLSPAYAAVFDVTPTDVTTRAASVVWVSDEPITSATVKVFSDPDGLTEITQNVTLNVVSEQYPPAHNLGIAKVDITGLAPSTPIYIQTETNSSSGTFLAPASPPFKEIVTATETTKVNTSNQPIVNDLIRHQAFSPDGVTPAPGTLVLLEVQGRSAYPISVFVGEGGFAAPDAVLDMNNIFGTDGFSAEVTGDEVLVITQLRGLLCAGAVDQKLANLRRAPPHVEVPAITELELPSSCFFANTVCDDVIDISDFQVVLSTYNRTLGECGFNPNYDLDHNGLIDVVDFQAVLNYYNATRPFQ
jgi:hypothetical protein